MTGDRDEDPQGPPWHERTSTVVGASVAGLALIGILYLLISYVVGAFNEPEQAPTYYIDPGGSSSSRTSLTTTTTETISSTSPPVTTDINPSDGSSTTSSSDTSTSDTTTTRTTRETEEDGPTISRSRPRLNETRTLYPRP